MIVDAESQDVHADGYDLQTALQSRLENTVAEREALQVRYWAWISLSGQLALLKQASML